MSLDIFGSAAEASTRLRRVPKPPRQGRPVRVGGTADEPRYPINSVDNALRLLLFFRERPLLRVAEASESLGVVRSTAHRLLAMLQYHGFVQQDPVSKAYRAGPSLVDIGLSTVREMDLRRHLRPYLERLSLEVGETVHLMELHGADAIFLDSVETSRALRTSSRVGRSYPAHTTSGGKVLLAELPPAQLAELYPAEHLSTVTDRSIRTLKGLLQELDLVRSRGYSTNRGESEVDVAAIAVPLRDAFGQARAAIAVSGPVSRLGDDDAPTIAEAASRIAAEASVSLL